MLKLNWHHSTITTNYQARKMIEQCLQTQPLIGSFDTETDGLHIIQSTPFLFQFGWIDPNMQDGYTYVVDLEKQPTLAHQVIKAWLKLATNFDIILGSNIKFDLHMLKNIGYDYPVENLSDTKFYIRHAHDAIPASAGGPPMSLKEYASKFVTHTAKHHENLIKKEQSQRAKELNFKLKQRLKDCGKPPEKYQAKSYTLGVLHCMFKDPIFDYHDLPSNIKEKYLEWLQEDVPLYLQPKVDSLIDGDMIPYNTLDRDTVITYGHYDIVYALEIYLKTQPTIEARETQNAIDIENSLIFPFFEMERVGFHADKEYLNTCRKNLKKYILQRRQDMYNMTQQEFSIGQHELVKHILANDFNVETPTVNKPQLNNKLNELKREGNNDEAVEFIETIQELRTLEKWYSTYIMRYIRELQNTNRLYTQIDQVGAVSGRVSSNFQQFPRDPITTKDGIELFHPRRIITPPPDELLVYIDWSQIELRLQALYTILVENPDLNLCRAFMPYECVRKDGTIFDYTNKEHLQNWDDGQWYYKEEPDKPWTPTDVHGVMGHTISGLKPENEGWIEARYIGKTTNFAKNYGATWAAIKNMFPFKPEHEITKINDAYYKSFPGVKSYHNYCYHRADYGATANLFGVKYYNASGHKLINYLIQGSAAYLLKLKIREIYDYMKAHNIKTRLQMNIHDELSWEGADKPETFFKFKEIMENWPDTLVPIVADVSVSNTAWSEKKEVANIEELRVYLES